MSLVKQLDSIFLVHQCYSFYFDNCFTSLSSRPLRRTHVIPDSAKGRSDLHLNEIQRVAIASPCVPFNARVREREMGFEQRNEPLSVVESVQVGLGTPVKPPSRLVNLCTVYQLSWSWPGVLNFCDTCDVSESPVSTVSATVILHTTTDSRRFYLFFLLFCLTFVLRRCIVFDMIASP